MTMRGCTKTVALATMLAVLTHPAAAEPGAVFWPTGTTWQGNGRVLAGPMDTVGKTLADLAKWFVIGDDGSINVMPEAPAGDYTIEWAVLRPSRVQAVQ